MMMRPSTTITAFQRSHCWLNCSVLLTGPRSIGSAPKQRIDCQSSIERSKEIIHHTHRHHLGTRPTRLQRGALYKTRCKVHKEPQHRRGNRLRIRLTRFVAQRSTLDQCSDRRHWLNRQANHHSMQFFRCVNSRKTKARNCKNPRWHFCTVVVCLVFNIEIWPYHCSRIQSMLVFVAPMSNILQLDIHLAAVLATTRQTDASVQQMAQRNKSASRPMQCTLVAWFLCQPQGQTMRIQSSLDVSLFTFQR
jgi:hypothetical protein